MTRVEPHGEVKRPVTATVRKNTGEKKGVNVNELRALAAAMPVHMIPAEAKKGAFIMYKHSEDGTMTGGEIMAVSEDSGELTVPRREQDRGMGKSWMPSWQDTKAARLQTGKKCPQGYSEHTDKTQGGPVLMTGELTMTHRMMDATYRRAISLQLMGSAPKLAPDMGWKAAPADTGCRLGCRLNRSDGL